MVRKCIEYLNCPTEMGLYLDAPTPTTIQLKDLIACQYINGIIPPMLTLTITIAPNASVTIIDDLCSLYDNPNVILWQSTLSFYLHNNSTLNYIFGQTHDLHCKKTCEKNNQIAKELNFVLLGKHAHVNAICSCMGTSNSSFTFTTTQEHKAPHTTSHLLIKGALTDKSRLKSNALIKVYKGCAAVTASQVNKNLLLSSDARALSIPKIEIETDDVNCRHNASASKINPEHLFYLQSKGFTAEQAQKDLVLAFLGTNTHPK